MVTIGIVFRCVPTEKVCSRPALVLKKATINSSCSVIKEVYQ